MHPVSALHAVSCSQAVSACGGDDGPTHGSIYSHIEWSLARLAYVRSFNSNFRFLAVSDSPVELHTLKSQGIQRRLQASFFLHGGKEQKQVTHLHGTSGTAGAIKGIMILFQHL